MTSLGGPSWTGGARAPQDGPASAAAQGRSRRPHPSTDGGSPDPAGRSAKNGSVGQLVDRRRSATSDRVDALDAASRQLVDGFSPRSDQEFRSSLAICELIVASVVAREPLPDDAAAALRSVVTELECDVGYLSVRCGDQPVRARAGVEADGAARLGDAVTRAVLDLHDDPVVITDDLGFIVVANGEAESVFGYGIGALESQHLSDLLPDGPAPRVLVRAPGADGTEEVHRAALGQDRAGRRFPVQVDHDAVPLPHGTGTVIRCRVVAGASPVRGYAPIPSDREPGSHDHLYRSAGHVIRAGERLQATADDAVVTPAVLASVRAVVAALDVVVQAVECADHAP